MIDTMKRWHVFTTRQIAALLLLSLALLLVRMAEFSYSGAGLHLDEAQYWVWSLDLQWGYFSKPPVLIAIIKASTTLFGDSLLGVKALAMACWLVCSWVLGWIGYRLAGPRTAIFAGALFAATVLSGLLGLSVTTDGPLSMFWAITMATIWLAAHTEGRKAYVWWVLCGLSFGLTVLSKYSGLALGLSGVWLLIAAPAAHRRKIFLGGLVAICVAFAVLMPHLLWNAANHWPTAQHTLDITVRESGSTVANGVGGWRRVIESVLEFSLGQILILGPTAWIVYALARKNSTQDQSPKDTTHLWSLTTFALAFSVPILSLGLIQAISSKAFVNWSAPMTLGVCLLLAWRADQALVSLKRFALACLVGFVFSGAVATGGDLKTWFGMQPPPDATKWELWSRMRGWHDALQALNPTLTPYRELPWITTNRNTLVQSTYELRHLKPKVFMWNPTGAIHHHFDWKQPWPMDADAPAVIWLAKETPPEQLLSRYPFAEKLDMATSAHVTLQAWLLQRERAKP
jgi:4-amino-4-deoxy-L-arabinose transferase-like glycosyltransferase